MLEVVPPEWRWKTYQQWMGKAVLKLMGWHMEGNIPLTVPKLLLVAGPHTAKRDLVILMASVMAGGRRIRWITTDIAMRFPYRWLMLKWGAIIIRYKQRNNLIPAMIELLQNNDYIMLVIAPEGNIYKVPPHWRAGFYHIAYGAGVPIVPWVMDFRKPKTMRWCEPITLTGDFKADMDKIRAAFGDAQGKYPERQAEIRLLEEDQTL